MEGTAREMINSFDNPLPGVPLFESPFFDDAIAELDLDEPTKAIAMQLHRQGWAVLDFPDPELEVVAERIKERCIRIMIGIGGARRDGRTMRGFGSRMPTSSTPMFGGSPPIRKSSRFYPSCTAGVLGHSKR